MAIIRFPHGNLGVRLGLLRVSNSEGGAGYPSLRSANFLGIDRLDGIAYERLLRMLGTFPCLRRMAKDPPRFRSTNRLVEFCVRLFLGSLWEVRTWQGDGDPIARE